MDGPDSGQGTSEECALQGQRLAEQGLYHMETLLVTSELPILWALTKEIHFSYFDLNFFPQMMLVDACSEYLTLSIV